MRRYGLPVHTVLRAVLDQVAWQATGLLLYECRATSEGYEKEMETYVVKCFSLSYRITGVVA
jgi:hypothetical protein